MCRIALILALMTLLPLGHATFVRPWENATWIATNPSIWSYGVEVWWDVPTLHNTITEMHVEEVAALETDATVTKSISKALDGAHAAGDYENGCVAGVALTLGSFPLLPLGPAIAAFSTIPQCLSYRGAWIGAVDNALAALEESGREADKAVADARASYDSAVFVGLCDPDYTGAGSERCAELKSAFASVDNGITEGGYGKYALLKQYEGEFGAGLAEPTPDLRLYPAMLELAWGEDGTISSFKGLKLASEKAKTDGELEYQSTLKSAAVHKEAAETRLDGLNWQRLGMIDRAPASFSSGKAGTVAERLKELGQRKLEMDTGFENAKITHGRTMERGHLSASIKSMDEADGAYEVLADEASELGTDAEETVAQQKDEAETELGRTEKQFSGAPPSSEASALFEEAQDAFASAERKGSLGERFYSYSHAAALARSARNERTQADEMGAKTSLAELEALIEGAEKDGINVVAEKENLKLMDSLSPYDAEPYIHSMIDSIIAKAKAKYEDALLAARERIYADLSIAGPEAADLNTDIERCDEGMFDGDSLLFPESIGKLARLKVCYATLLGELEQYKCSMIGNSMSLAASPHVGEVCLDSPTEITLDLILHSKSRYNCSNVEVKASLDSPWPFVYSDIVSGKEGVESVRSEDGGKLLVLVLKNVKPEETKRIIFAKTVVLAHMLKEEREADGLGEGAALVRENTTFELDCRIWRLSVDGSDAAIDGLPTDRSLGAGKHVLSVEREVNDAYEEEIANVKAYLLGMNSQVEYDVRILPSMDLGGVPILLDSLNDSHISSFRAVSATGEAVKDERRISETQYGLTVSGLKRGREAVVKVSYTVERTDSFVEEELRRLGALNLSADAKNLVEQARMAADIGDYAGALALLERSKAAQKAEDTRSDKLRKDREALAVTVRGELDEINGMLELFNGSNSTFVGKLGARAGELELALNGSGNGSLEKVDMKWLGKEIAAFGKDAYLEYGTLKEQFYLAGNATTPQEFLDFEAALNRLESGARLENAAGVLAALDKVRRMVESQERMQMLAAAGMKDSYAGLRSQVQETLAKYLKQATAAKGTEYASVFQESEKSVDKLLADADAAAGKDANALKTKMAELNKSERRMSLTLESLRNESGAKLSMLSRLLAAKPDGKKKDAVQGELDNMRGFVEGGDYVTALRAGSTIAKELDGSGWGETPGGNGLLVLGLTAFAVLAAIGVYVVKNGRGEPKKLRRLHSMERPPLEPPSGLERASEPERLPKPEPPSNPEPPTTSS